MWGQLKKSGILQGQLINHVWSKFEPNDRIRLLEIMEQFDLICIAPHAQARTKEPSGASPKQKTVQTDLGSTRTYYVPSLFNPGIVKEEEDLAAKPSVTFFVDFHGLFTSKNLFSYLLFVLYVSVFFLVCVCFQ